MPVLSTFYGIIIYIYAREHNPPHIHAKYQGQEIAIDLDGEVLEGKLPKKQLRLVQAWIELYRDEIYANWEFIQAGQEIVKISPLR